MSNSHYIESMAAGEFEELSSGPLLEGTRGIELSGFYSSIVDLISGGNRGQAFTWALNATELSTDPAALQAAYDANPDPINEYLQHVDIDQIIRNISEPEQEEVFSIAWFRSRGPAFLIGAAIGTAGFMIYNKTKN